MSRWSPILTVLALSSVTQACSSADAAAPGHESDVRPFDPSEAPTVAFTESSITLLPGVSHSFGLRVSPAASAQVHLSLVGDSADAFLDTGVVTTDGTGAGTFTLTAASNATTFRVKATLGPSSAELTVAVSDSSTSLTVWPVYYGLRKASSWVATVAVDGKCNAQSGGVDTDGPFVTEASIGLPQFAEVPADVPLKVTVRSGHFVGGCIETRASAGHLLGRLVFVAANDRPLQLGSANLAVKLGLDTGDGWANAWSDVVDGIVDRFVAKKSDSAALLDAMYAACHPTAAPSFVSARSKAAWDLRLSSAFDSILGVGNLTRKLRSFLTTGVGANGEITIEGSLVSGRSTDGKATLSLSTIGGIAAAKASLSPSIEATWTQGAGDRVLFGGSASFHEVSLAAALGEAVALEEVPSTKTFPAALAKTLSCSDVAKVLVGSTGSEVAYGSCGEFCVASLCEAALESMWTRATTSSAKASTMELSANGTVTSLSDSAAPLAFNGTWVGTTTVAGRQARVSGKASGATEPTSVP